VAKAHARQVRRPATSSASHVVAPDPAPAALDRVIHERVRLGIVSALVVNESLSFTDLRDLIGATDGNLSVHARRLEDVGYVSCTKTFEGRTPRTVFKLTPAGRVALTRYLDHMEAIIRAMKDR
jgi:DNA-binding MarR family transcriptional regulator